MQNKPNILFIVSDQHRYDCTGYAKDYPVKTPNIDRIAEEGMWFTNAYTNIPLCCPARQSFLSGRRPEDFGALWNYDFFLKIQALEPDEYVWPRELNTFNYQCGYIGKWHVNPQHTPLEYGFQDYISEADYKGFRQKKYPEHQFVNGFFGELDSVPLEDTQSHWLASKAIDTIKKYSESEDNWMVQLHLPEPHIPCNPTKKFTDKYSIDQIPEWRSFKENFENKPYIQKQQLLNWGIEDYTWDDWAPIVARYYAIITQMDEAIGNVLEYLDSHGLAENTLVIYTADHGDMNGGHRMMDKHYIMYDDVLRVPLAIRWPVHIKPGSVCDNFVSHFLDLPPTVLDILGIDIPDFFEGCSLLPILKDEHIENWRQEVVSTYNGQQFGLYTQRMIRTEEWKYIWNTTDVDELYNMKEDPEELYNLIYDSSVSNTLEDLRKTLWNLLTKQGDKLINSWTKKQLLEGKKI